MSRKIDMIPLTNFETIHDVELELDNHFITTINCCYDLLKNGYSNIVIEPIGETCINCEKRKTCPSSPENFSVNTDYKCRNKILCGNVEIMDNDYMQFGITRFSINRDQLQQLIDLKFLNPKAYHNKSLPVDAFILFYDHLLEMHGAFKDIQFLGFAISEKRKDYRIEIDGIKFLDSENDLTESEEFLKCIGIFSKATYFYLKNDGFLFWYD